MNQYSYEIFALILSATTRWRIYYLSDSKMVQHISTKNTIFSSHQSDDFPCGLCILSKAAVGFITVSSPYSSYSTASDRSFSMTLIATKEYYECVRKETSTFNTEGIYKIALEEEEGDEIAEQDKKEVTPTMIDYYYYDDYCDVLGNVKFPYFLQAKPNQERIIQLIMENYFSFAEKRIHYSLSVFISGPIGIGKSCIPFLLAKKIGSDCSLIRYEHSSKLSITGTYMDCQNQKSRKQQHNNNNHNSMNKTTMISKDPIILVIDEVDFLFEKFEIPYTSSSSSSAFPSLKDKIHQSKLCSMDRQKWNGFLDDFDRGLFPNCILIMTSNLSKEEIDLKFPSTNGSLLRPGRIHLMEHLLEEKNKENECS
jgi:hypothetical protein